MPQDEPITVLIGPVTYCQTDFGIASGGVPALLQACKQIEEECTAMFWATNTFNFGCNPKETATTGGLESHFWRVRDFCKKKGIQNVILTSKADFTTSHRNTHDSLMLELTMFDLMKRLESDTWREGLQKLTLEITIVTREHTIELTSEQHQFQFQVDAFNYRDSRQKARELAEDRLAAMDVNKYLYGGRRLAWFLGDIGLTSDVE